MPTERINLGVTGQVGLNLQATKKGVGAFVDSFYREIDPETGVEAMLPAEATYGIKLLGSIIHTVNGLDVTESPALDICKIISKAARPLQLTFLQHDQQLDDSCTVVNYATLPWLLEHLEELTREKSEKSDDLVSLLKGKLLCHLDCERVLSNLKLLKLAKGQKLATFLESLMSPFPEVNLALSLSECEQSLTEITSILRKDLIDDFLPSFLQSATMRRMKGYHFRSLPYNDMAFLDILANKAALFHFFLYLSKPNRRHLQLLFYLQMVNTDLQADTFEMLIFCSSALNLCKETSLLTYKARLDRIIDILRKPGLLIPNWIIDNSRPALAGGSLSQKFGEFYEIVRQLLSDIADALVWEFIVGIYPSFQASKDYAPLDSNLSSNSEIASNISLIGSINDLLRNKKLTSSLSVHRQGKTIVPLSREDLKGSLSVAMFDTYIDLPACQQKIESSRVVMSGITEDECTFTKVKIKGHVDRVQLSSKNIIDGTWSAESDIYNVLQAMSPFLVPTGKASIQIKNGHGHPYGSQYPPEPKVYSMVLSARDQVQIYVCSLVFYRPVLLFQNLESNSVENMRTILSLNKKDEGSKAVEESSLESPMRSKEVQFKAVSLKNCERKKNISRTENSPLDTVPSSINTVSLQHDINPSILIYGNTQVPLSQKQSIDINHLSQCSSVRSELTVVSNLTAVSPEINALTSCVPCEDSMQSVDSPIFAEVYEPNAFMNFSDDESAGLKSSSILELTPAQQKRQVNTEMGPVSFQTAVTHRHGTFAEFLSATATATVTAASAIAFQAGALPAPTFSWVSNPNPNGASKISDSKGFYNNLNFSRFRTMNFANSEEHRQADTQLASGLKRKFDGLVTVESASRSEDDKAPSDLDSMASPQSAHSENIVPLLVFSRGSPTPMKSSYLTPERPSLSSYPKFGHVKLSKRSVLSALAPSRSPRHKMRNQIRKYRIASSVVIPRPEVSFSANTSRKCLTGTVTTDEESTFDTAITDNSSEPALLVGLSSLHLTSDSTILLTETYKAIPEDLSPTETQVTEKTSVGIVYVAHGICLFTQDPLVGTLRETAAAVAPEFHCLSLSKDGRDVPTTVLPPSVKKTIINSLHDRLGLEDPSLSSRHGEQAKDYNSALILDALSPKNLVAVLVAFLLEYRIVVVSSRSLSGATHLGEFLKEAIYPLKYSHVYSPLVPPTIGLQLIHCPAPFYIGMSRSSAIDDIVELEDERDREKNKGRRNRNSSGRDHSCGLLIVDMDRDECSMPQDLCNAVRSAKVLIRALETLLKPELSRCDEISGVSAMDASTLANTLAEGVMRLCSHFVGSLLQGFEMCCIKVDDEEEKIVLFDELMFLQQHVIRYTLHSPLVLKYFDELDKQKSSVNCTLSKEGLADVLLLPPIATANGGKDFEKLIRSLMRTQSFSSYLTT